MKVVLLIVVSFVLFSACNKQASTVSYSVDKSFMSKISKQLKNSIDYNNENFSKSNKVFPRTINSDGEVLCVNARDWTSGFYPGVLWFAYELSHETIFRENAIKYTEQLENEKFNGSDHDIGFKIMSSYGKGYEDTGNEQYRDVIVQSARTLISRYNDTVGCIRSWDHHKAKWQYPVIIDNLMNLELLFKAWKETGEPVFYNIAVKHAQTTAKNHFRNNFSCYHVVDYNKNTGEVISKGTHQGYADESSWARGQAWALYGYTMIYRETKKIEFLQQAEKVANYILNVAKLPEDLVPVWDYNAPANLDEPKDASAAAVTASALFELSTYTESHEKLYISAANKMLESLSSKEYFNDSFNTTGFLLKHSTGSKPKGSEIDVPLVYADYYYLEALSRKIEYKK